MYIKATWERVTKFVKIIVFQAEALLKGFDQTRGVGNNLSDLGQLPK